MKIVTSNIDRLLRVELSKICEMVSIKDNPKGAFIQWVNGSVIELSGLFNKQTTIIKHCISEGIPLIIFDKFQQMTEEEITFLIKPGIILWEPALNDRMFFSYQPHWGVFPDSLDGIPWNFDEKRPIDLGYYSSLVKLLPTFQKYYQPISETGEHKVVYFDYDNKDIINNKVEQIGVAVQPTLIECVDTQLSSIKTTILLGTERDYKTGHLPPQLFEYLQHGVVPMLPREHKWFHSIFNGLVISKPFDTEYILKTYDNIGFGIIHDVYSGLAEHLPESNVVNVAKRISSFFE